MRLFRLILCLLVVAVGAPVRAQSTELLRETFESWEPAGSPVGWQSNSAGWTLERDEGRPAEGAASARLAAASEDRAAFGVLVRALPAESVRGKRIRLSAQVRTPAEPGGATGLWLRVDRAGGARGFFDNMSDRPIVSPQWGRFTIEGDVAADADRIVFGLLQATGGEAWIDDLRIEVLGDAPSAGPAPPVLPAYASTATPQDAPPSPLSEQGLANLKVLAAVIGRVRYFHPSDEAAGADWDRLAVAAVRRIEPAAGAKDLAAALEEVFAPVAPSMRIGETRQDASPPEGRGRIAWRHEGLQTRYQSVYRSERVPAPPDLVAEPLIATEGLRLDLPLAVWLDAEGRTSPQAARPSLAAGLRDQPLSAFDRPTRLASVILAWSTLSHFYPYFDVAADGWYAALDVALAKAATDATPRSFAKTLLGLTAALEDGHAQVVSPWLRRGRAPVALDHLSDQVVVVGRADGAGDLKVGDVLVEVAGEPVGVRLAREEALASGSPQWRRYLAMTRLLDQADAREIEVAAERADGSRYTTSVSLQAAGPAPLREPRPEPVADLGDGLLYVDITRLDEAALAAARPRIEAATGIVFDLRGYPRANPWYLAHLSDRTVRSPPFDVPIYLRPDQEDVDWTSRPWVIAPASPTIPRAVFIADESAISFAESILATAAGEDLASIVGRPSAGANGNVNALDLPGGYRIIWTGMRVTRHDGGVHHNVGVQPTVPQDRTLEGVRSGRDQLLERAIVRLRTGS